MKKLSRKLLFAQAVMICMVCPEYLPGAENPDAAISSEFDVFNAQPEESGQGKKEPVGLQIDLVVQKSFPRDSLFLPEKDFAVFDPVAFTQALRFSKKINVSGSFSLNLDLGLHNTTSSQTQTLKTLDTIPGTTDLINAAYPMLPSELSFLHFYMYEFFFTLNPGASGEDVFFFSAGVLPVRQGNSFYKNPVSFFERYLPPREFIQEYTPLSFPGVKLSYIRGIYHVDVLFVPEITYQKIGEPGQGQKLADYLYFVNQAGILMAKNSLGFSGAQMDFFFFLENKSENKNPNHYGFGWEITLRILKDLNMGWQILASNGRPQYTIFREQLFDTTWYSYKPVENSSEEYRVEALVSMTYSGVENYDIGLGYYYNGFGLSTKDYNKLARTLELARTGYQEEDSLFSLLHLQFFSNVLAQYNIFALNQHYAFINIVNLKNVEVFTWGLSAFITLQQLSVMPVLFLNYNINANSKLFVQLSGSIGKDKTIFEENMAAGAVNGGVQWIF